MCWKGCYVVEMFRIGGDNAGANSDWRLLAAIKYVTNELDVKNFNECIFLCEDNFVNLLWFVCHFAFTSILFFVYISSVLHFLFTSTGQSSCYGWSSD